MKRLLTIAFILLAFTGNAQQQSPLEMFYALNQPPASSITANSFVTKWVIPSSSYTLTIPFTGSPGTNNFVIDWGDGSVEGVTSNISKTHVYAASGTYTIAITGSCFFINFASKSELREITQWGNIGCTTFSCAGSGLTTISAVSNNTFFSSCTSLANAFKSCAITSVPPGIFASAKSVTTFLSCFQQTHITTLPAGTFDSCKAVTIFNSCFQQTTTLTSIPSG